MVSTSGKPMRKQLNTTFEKKTQWVKKLVCVASQNVLCALRPKWPRFWLFFLEVKVINQYIIERQQAKLKYSMGVLQAEAWDEKACGKLSAHEKARDFHITENFWALYTGGWLRSFNNILNFF